MQRLVVATGLASLISIHYASAFGITFAASGNHLTNASMMAATRLNAQKPSSASSTSSSSLHTDSKSVPKSKPKKKNKYANFSKADNLSMDPLDAMINESRSKLRELHGEDPKKTRRRRKSSSSDITSLEAVDQLLSAVDGDMEEVVEDIVEEKRDR